MRAGPFADALAALRPADAEAARLALARQDRLTKPAGALGRLEALSAQLAAVAGTCPPPVPVRPAVAVFAGDHGVLAEGVSPWAQEVTAQMVANFLAGGAAINVLAREVGAFVVVVDVGVATPVPAGPGGHDVPAGEGLRLVKSNVRLGTGNIAVEPAMTGDEALAALDAGARLAAELVGEGADLLVTGDMGIGNTTPSAAIVAALTGRAAREVTGRGTGISDEVFELKVGVIERALLRAEAATAGSAGAATATPSGITAAGITAAGTTPLTVLAELGGLEIAALAGYVVGGAAARLPVVVDGVIALAACLVAAALAPDVVGYLVAGHRSTEPGATAALESLKIEPLLDLGLRLGEGTGACLAVPLVRGAARLLSEMASFDAAGVSTLES